MGRMREETSEGCGPMSLANRIAQIEPPMGSIALFFLGQAGFCFKAPGGQVIYLDPYLTNSLERLFGMVRLVPSPIAPEEVVADLVITTHEHGDHLDPDAVPVIAGGTSAHFLGSVPCGPVYQELGVPADRASFLSAGQSLDFGGTRITGVEADHGDLATGVIGVVLDFNGPRVYFTSDTAYRPDLLEPVAALSPHIVLPCINGTFGNMTAQEAASVIARLKPALAIPCHYGMTIEHGGDPGEFVGACQQLAPEVRVEVMEPGDYLIYP